MKKNILFNSVIRIILFVFFSQLFLACTGTSEKKAGDRAKISTQKPALRKPPSSYTDTLIITTQAAVFYNSDSLQLEKIKFLNTKMVFEAMMHDCFFQMRNARREIRKYFPQIKIIETSKARYLLFIKADKSRVIIDLNTKYDTCGILIFDQKKDPELVDMMNIDTDMGFYFKK